MRVRDSVAKNVFHYQLDTAKEVKSPLQTQGNDIHIETLLSMSKLKMAEIMSFKPKSDSKVRNLKSTVSQPILPKRLGIWNKQELATVDVNIKHEFVSDKVKFEVAFIHNVRFEELIPNSRNVEDQ